MREQSFMKSLFFGVIDESLIFPWPEPPAPRSTRCTRSSTACAASSTCGSTRRRSTASSASPTRCSRACKELGLFGLLVPQSYGGLGLSTTGYARVMQEIGGLDSSVARDARRAPVDRR